MKGGYGGDSDDEKKPMDQQSDTTQHHLEAKTWKPL